MADIALKPTRENIMSLLKSRKDHVFNSLHREMEIDEDFLEGGSELRSRVMDRYIRVFGNDWDVRYIPLARVMVENMARAVYSGEVAVKVTSKLPDAHKAEIEEWVRALFHWCAHGGTLEDPFEDASEQQAALGACWIGYALDKSKYPKRPDGGSDEELAEYEEAVRNCVPFDVRSVHPARLMWDTAVERFGDVVLEEPFTVAMARRTYPHAEGLAGERWDEKKPDESLMRVTYCSADWYGVWVGGVPVLEGCDEEGLIENPWGRVFYQGALAGLGKQSRDYALVNRVQGVIRPYRGLIIGATVGYNAKELTRVSRGMPGTDFFQTTGGASIEEVRTTAKNYETGPLAVNAIPAGITVQQQQLPQLPNWWMNLDDDTRAYLEMGAVNLLRGTSGTDNATVLLANRDAALKRFASAKKSFGQMMAQMAMDILHFIKQDFTDGEKLYLPVQDGFKMLNPAHIPEGGVRLTVDPSPPGAAEQAAEYDHVRSLWQDGHISQETLRARQGIEDGAGEDRRLRKERLRFADGIMNLNIELVSSMVRERFGLLQAGEKEREAAGGAIDPDALLAQAKERSAEQQAAQMQQQFSGGGGGMVPAGGGGRYDPVMAG